MNLILFEQNEIVVPLLRTDPRATHILSVLKRKPGDSFDVGVVDGPRGKGTLRSRDDKALHLEFTWGEVPPPPDAITLLIGMPRPQTARDVLRDLTTLGVAEMHFVATEKSESSYADSTLWASDEWKRHAKTGAAQAFDTRVPRVSFRHSLSTALAELDPSISRVALDNYEATSGLADIELSRARPIVIAIGPERGWSAQDRAHLRAARFELVHLGHRVLRTEVACVVAVSLIKAKRRSF